jgi:3-hydroxy acid dehydrogenase / malonic semialdehyde reductase
MIAQRTVLITGASSGFGAAVARRLAADGANLVLWARRKDRLKALAAELSGVRVQTAGVDVRDRNAIAVALSDLDEAPHALINNAGLGMGIGKFHEADPDDWDVTIDTNLKGFAYVARAVIPMMLDAGRGHIVNIGSTASRAVGPNSALYAATKHAVRALNEGMNIDLAGTPIRVSLVDPGYAETEFGLVRHRGDVARAKQTYKGFRPMTADDVAAAIAYVVNTPEHLNIAELVIVPAAQRNMYTVDREDS